MGIREEFTAINVIVAELATDVKWLVESRKEELAAKNISKNTRLWVVAISTPVVLSFGIFMAGVLKDIDILRALHKPQIAIFEKGGGVVDLYQPTTKEKEKK